jgi:hypothetical protein
VSIPDSHRHLFKLDWVHNPALLAEQQSVTGISSQYTAEIAAWCVELHLQLQELAAEMGLRLLLMGGNGAALRMGIACLRGSADNDYLTSAGPNDVQALIDALAARFAGLPDGLLQPNRIAKPEGAEELPLLAYRVAVPKLFDPNPAIDALSVKLEFHLDDDLPPSENITVAHGIVGQALRADIPLLPHQVALKLMTLLDPPIGIDAAREAAVARQIYDIDMLLAAVVQADEWDVLREYTAHRYAKETGQRGQMPIAGEPWAGVRARLQTWATCADRTTIFWRHVNAMQSSQLARSSQRTPEQWAERCNRLAVAARCLEGLGRFDLWQRALAVEARIPARAAGPGLRAIRRAIRGATRTSVGNPRTTMWAALAEGEDVDELAATVDLLNQALARV